MPSLSRSTIRVGLVGARRVRLGTGPYLARFLHGAGARVVAVAGTSLETAREAADALHAAVGTAATPHRDARAMVAAGGLDLLAIASPPGTHGDLLRLALDAGLHVLCEKPLLEGGAGDPEEAARLSAAFAAKSLLLAVAAQWRFALPAYMRLFPAVAPREAASFSLRMSPSAPGPSMLADALPHAFALLDHLYGAFDVPLGTVRVAFPSPGEARVSFVHPGGRSGVACEARLVAEAAPPRTLEIGFNGHVATREIEMPAYRMRLVDPGSGRAVDLPDPYEALVRDVVARVRRGPPFPADPTVASVVARLAQVLAVAAGGVAPAEGGG